MSSEEMNELDPLPRAPTPFDEDEKPDDIYDDFEDDEDYYFDYDDSEDDFEDDSEDDYSWSAGYRRGWAEAIFSRKLSTRFRRWKIRQGQKLHELIRRRRKEDEIPF